MRMIAVRYQPQQWDEREEHDPVRLSNKCIEAVRITEALEPHERLYVDRRVSDLIDLLRKIYATRKTPLTPHEVDQRITYDIATLRINLGRELLQKRTPTTLVA